MALNENRKLIIKIRALKPRDFGEVISNYYNAYDEVKRNTWLGINLFPQKPSLKDERDWFKRALEMDRKGDGFALVAEVEGKVIGICDVRNKALQQEQRHIGAVGIYVLEGYRSQGVGSALLGTLINTAKEQGKYEILILSVFGNNNHAQGLYKKFGFLEYGRLPHGIRRNGECTDEVGMYRRL